MALCFSSTLLLVGFLVFIFRRGIQFHDKVFAVLWFAATVLWLLGTIQFHILAVSRIGSLIFLMLMGLTSLALFLKQPRARLFVLFVAITSLLFNGFVTWLDIGQTIWFHENEGLPLSFDNLLYAYFPFSMATISVAVIAITTRRQREQAAS